ncbi:MAG: gamma-glutamylcyclotransferase [Alphaproteobacteria bacterium]|nr:gamma-glutamylcyclotransferase [Alphaproteobacteria bacterium]
MLKREELTPERVDQIAREAREAGFDYFLTREERERRLAEALAWWTRGTDAWVFGYGSLMWNPAFHFVERRPARLEGYRRSFCFWTPMGRGTPEKPGLMLAIEKGGVCDGMAYRVAAADVEAEFSILFNREMLSGIYEAVWVEVTDAAGQHLRAVTFVINPAHPQYSGRLEMDRKADHIAFAEGRRGTCRSYLFDTADHLRGLGVSDPYIDTLESEVLRLRGGKR